MTNLPQKRSEHGASLILLVAIIGLAFIVTVAAFLLSASNGQNTARLASAKVDIANREDVLMRVILQQTATGMLPGTNGITGTPASWNTIMTNAVTQLRATTYGDPTELATLGLSGVTPANMGDTGGTPLGIFQGYNNSEVPFGGTSGLANVVNPYVVAMQPPLMGWSASPLLSSATAVTSPQELFLGSLYTSTSTPVTSDIYSKHWGRITYPNIRFGYKQPGDTNFIARRVWWRVPVLYKTAQQTVEELAAALNNPSAIPIYRFPGALANYILSVYEIPSQLPISGNANLQIGLNGDGTAWGSGINVTGSIYGGEVQLFGGTFNGVSSRQQVNILNPVTVGLVPYSKTTNSLFDQPGMREQMALTQATPGAAPVSVAGNDGKVLLVPVMPGNDFYMAAPGTPTNWDYYARPYYRCRIRIMISATDSHLIYPPSSIPNTGAGAITVKIYVNSDTLSLPDQILGFPDSAATLNGPYTQAYDGDPAGNLPTYLSYTSTGPGTVPDRNILEIDVRSMVSALGDPTQLYSIYIGTNPTTVNDPGIAIWNTEDLGAFSKGLSIVTNKTLYLNGSFNQGATKPPTSIYAPEVRYGVSGAPISNVALNGQISVDPTSSATTANPLNLLNASGTSIPVTLATFNEIIDLNLIPPIARTTLMFTIEKEH